MRVIIDLSEQDLDYFRAAMRKSREAAAHLGSEEITNAALKLLEDTRDVQMPEYVAARLRKLNTMIAMVHDKGWGLTDAERKEVLSALTYFSDPNDIIPDNVPVLGFLDDAIMIELVVEELKHEMDAYEDFCQFRAAAVTEEGVTANGLNREDWLAQRQEELLERMRSRRSRDRSYGAGGGGSFSIFSMS